MVAEGQENVFFFNHNKESNSCIVASADVTKTIEICFKVCEENRSKKKKKKRSFCTLTQTHARVKLPRDRFPPSAQ